MKTIRMKKIENRGGSVSWKVSGTVQGKHRRQNVPTEGEALTLKQNWERENANAVPLPAITTRLNEAQARQAESCFARLDAAQVSANLVELLEFALANYRPARTSKPIAEAFTQFMDAKRAANKRPATLAKLAFRVGQLVKLHGGAFERDSNGQLLVTVPGKPVHELQPEQLRTWIFRNGSSVENQDTDYRAASAFLNWCVKQEFAQASPLAKIENVKVERGEPVALTVAQARNLLNQAHAFKKGVLVPYVVLSMLCGIRPAELARLTWDDVDLTGATVTIPARIAKMRARRTVAMHANAVEMLTPFALARAPFVHANWRKDFAALRKAAGFTSETWAPDILRHTAISYHFAECKHDGQTAQWAGNSPDVIHQHYKALVRASDAVEFWNLTATITPPIPIRKAA